MKTFAELHANPPGPDTITVAMSCAGRPEDNAGGPDKIKCKHCNLAACNPAQSPGSKTPCFTCGQPYGDHCYSRHCQIQGLTFTLMTAQSQGYVMPKDSLLDLTPDDLWEMKLYAERAPPSPGLTPERLRWEAAAFRASKHPPAQRALENAAFFDELAHQYECGNERPGWNWRAFPGGRT